MVTDVMSFSLPISKATFRFSFQNRRRLSVFSLFSAFFDPSAITKQMRALTKKSGCAFVHRGNCEGWGRRKKKSRKSQTDATLLPLSLQPNDILHFYMPTMRKNFCVGKQIYTRWFILYANINIRKCISFLFLRFARSTKSSQNKYNAFSRLYALHICWKLELRWT